MVNASSRGETKSSDWKAILSGGFLTVVFMLCADLISRALGTASLAPGLSAVAWFLAGMLTTRRLVPGVHPVKPAVGGAAAIVLLGIAELATLSRGETEIAVPQAALFIGMLGLIAFLLTFLGARVGRLLRERRLAR